jgi:hypothetical protein
VPDGPEGPSYDLVFERSEFMRVPASATALVAELARVPVFATADLNSHEFSDNERPLVPGSRTCQSCHIPGQLAIRGQMPDLQF